MVEAEAQAQYIVGRSFQDNTGWRLTGDRLTFDDVAVYPALDSLLAAGFLYRYNPAEGYDRLPPHLFSATQTENEALAKIAAGEAAQPGADWEESEQVKASRSLKEVELASIEANNIEAHRRATKFYETVNTTESGPVRVKAQAAKTDTKRGEAAKAGYYSMSKDELVNEINLRNKGRNYDKLSTAGSKTDLANRLAVDDAR